MEDDAFWESGRSIFMQIADRISDEILAGTMVEDGRIPSVREYSALLQVNNTTTVKAFEELARAGIIQNRRGLGFFVCPGAKELIANERRALFKQKTLATLFRQMAQLGISIDEVVQEYHAQKNNAQT